MVDDCLRETTDILNKRGDATGGITGSNGLKWKHGTNKIKDSAEEMIYLPGVKK
jgi:hypothetical protein